MTMAVASKVSKAETKNVNDELLGRSPDILMLGATSFNDSLPSDLVVAAFPLLIKECTVLLGATLAVSTLDSQGNTDPSAGCDKQGAAVVVAAEELLRGDA
jgi:hypothetical protein